jgi:hypothetical protein
MAKVAARQSSVLLERIAAVCAALAIVRLVVFLLIRNEKIADPGLSFALRLVLSFSIAVFGATIPGFLGVDWSGGGLTVRASGALALFILTYIYTPNFATEQGQNGQITINAPGGVGVERIDNSSITVNSPPAKE